MSAFVCGRVEWGLNNRLLMCMLFILVVDSIDIPEERVTKDPGPNAPLPRFSKAKDQGQPKDNQKAYEPLPAVLNCETHYNSLPLPWEEAMSTVWAGAMSTVWARALMAA